MSPVRFRPLEAIFAVLFVAGGGSAERPVRRTLDRLAATLVIVPLGLAIVGWGALTTVAPSLADQARSWVKSIVAQDLTR